MGNKSSSVAPLVSPSQSSTRKAEDSITWVIKDFRSEVENAVESKSNIVARTIFQDRPCVSCGTSTVCLTWALWMMPRDFKDIALSAAIRLILLTETNPRSVSKKKHCAHPPTPEELSERFSIETYVNGSFMDHSFPSFKGMLESITCKELFSMGDSTRFLDEDGTLKIHFKIGRYAEANGYYSLIGGDRDLQRPWDVTLAAKCEARALKGFLLMLGDQDTSDFAVVVVQAKMEVGTFYCHRAVLSARSSVLKAMLREGNDMKEKTDGFMRISDATVKAVEQFLHFLYCGRLRDERTDGGELLWIKLLPELLYLAEKYNLSDLKIFCAVNFHRFVPDDIAQNSPLVTIPHKLVWTEEESSIRKQLLE